VLQQGLDGVFCGSIQPVSQSQPPQQGKLSIGFGLRLSADSLCVELRPLDDFVHICMMFISLEYFREKGKGENSDQ